MSGRLWLPRVSWLSWLLVLLLVLLVWICVPLLWLVGDGGAGKKSDSECCSLHSNCFVFLLNWQQAEIVLFYNQCLTVSIYLLCQKLLRVINLNQKQLLKNHKL